MSHSDHSIGVYPDNYGDTITAECSCGWIRSYPWDDPETRGGAVPISLIREHHDAWIASRP